MTSNEPKKAKKYPKILDGKYFEINGDVDAKGNVKVKCTTCNDVKSGNISSTGNFFKHYEKKHALILNDVKHYTKIKFKDTNNSTNQPKLSATFTSIDSSEVCFKLIAFLKFDGIINLMILKY